MRSSWSCYSCTITKNSILVICFLSLNLLSSRTIKAAPTHLSQYCPNTTTFTPNGTNALFSLLTTNATAAVNGFAYNTAGQSPSDRAYGLFLCRGDLANDTCRFCVETATKDALGRYCPIEKSTVIWYDECMLHYSNQSIFSTMLQEPAYLMQNTKNVTEPARFLQVLGSTVNGLIPKVASGGSAKKFGVAEMNFTVLDTLSVLAQCTPDLTESECYRCLQGAASSLPREREGGRIFNPSCNIRFEFYLFYNNESAVATLQAPTPSPSQPPLPLPPPSATISRLEGKKISTAVIVAIVVPSGVAMALFLLGCSFLLRKSSTKRESSFVQDESDGNKISSVESLQFDYSTIRTATNDFAHENKLGEGGFGAVYKGTLCNGQNVAVKRLSRHSGQGTEQFKNEIMLVAKLQHRNLVKIQGFCLEGEEKLLIYEYVPNNSLYSFLFGQKYY